ncbi:MAG TPA: NAD-dependent epimerase/dehydratase family protein [Blastocatellia bacterium]|nr:NAD-dependent epimerase/dehydratase family protein [Blastocatellia bacterium]
MEERKIKGRILVTGAGGFIGHHLINMLKSDGHWVRGVDLKKPQFEPTQSDEFKILDLRRWENCLAATRDVDQAYNLAADMGGIGYITLYLAEIARNNTLINSHMLEASRANGVKRFLFTSSACIYPKYRQEREDIISLKEEDAYPAYPEAGYGWEKLYAEQLCQYYKEDFGLETRIARLHNVYGPLGTFDGGREKAPAAICRKVALAPEDSEIEIWGDGNQTRSFLYIDDCVEGLIRLMASDWREPLNIGSDRLISVNQLAKLVIQIANKKMRIRNDPSKPQGVRGRNSDNTRSREVLKWKPSVELPEGLTITYKWIQSQLT